MNTDNAPPTPPGVTPETGLTGASFTSKAFSIWTEDTDTAPAPAPAHATTSDAPSTGSAVQISKSVEPAGIPSSSAPRVGVLKPSAPTSLVEPRRSRGGMPVVLQVLMAG